MMYWLRGGAPEAVKGLQADEMPVGWTADGRALILLDETPASAPRLVRIDPETGDRRVLIELKRSDPVNNVVGSVVLSEDASTYVASYQDVQATLFVVNGLLPRNK